MDEAGQCLEIDTFIPLRLGIRCLLLFGDPEQLSPTILSRVAQNAKLGQSLLERLYSLFKRTDLIRMLNTVSLPIDLKILEFDLDMTVLLRPTRHFLLRRRLRILAGKHRRLTSTDTCLNLLI